MQLTGRLAESVQALVDRYKLEPLILPGVHTTDERVRRRRELYGEYELSVAPIMTNGEEVLLVKKSDRAGGYWSIPGGFREKSEEIEATGIREAREETGLDVDLLRPVAIVKSAIVAKNEGRLDYYLVMYRTRIVGGELKAADKNEIAEVRFVSPAEMDKIIMEGPFTIAHPTLDVSIIPVLRTIVAAATSSPGLVHAGKTD